MHSYYDIKRVWQVATHAYTFVAYNAPPLQVKEEKGKNIFSKALILTRLILPYDIPLRLCQWSTNVCEEGNENHQNNWRKLRTWLGFLVYVWGNMSLLNSSKCCQMMQNAIQVTTKQISKGEGDLKSLVLISSYELDWHKK